MSRTTEENFLLSLYELSCANDGPIAVDLIARKVSMNSKKCQSILKSFVRGNFIRKDGEGHIVLIEHGRNVAKSLLESN